MDSTTFDTVARNVSTVVSRRSALRGLVAGALAVSLGGTATQTEAKRRRSSKKEKGLRHGQRCMRSQQCRNHDDGIICGQPRIFAAERVCCGGIDAICDDASGKRCCYGYLCNGGRCIVV